MPREAAGIHGESHKQQDEQRQRDDGETTGSHQSRNDTCAPVRYLLTTTPFRTWNNPLLHSQVHDHAMTVSIKIRGPLVNGVFVDRLNRFLIHATINQKSVHCFLPNPGRLEELLYPGAELILAKRQATHRKTDYDVVGVNHMNQSISIDSRIPNRLVYAALKKQEIQELSEYTSVQPEYTYGDSRIDFRLSNSETCLLEVKSCTLVLQDTALFPDAPTVRGRRHVEELIEAHKTGKRACILFLIQRTDAHRFSPNGQRDPEFADIFRRAIEQGVEAYAYTSAFIEDRIELRGRIPVAPSATP
jgi:sugar fermentation stimulation protein A